MDSRGPADQPPARDRPDPEGTPGPGGDAAAPPVLSLEERKTERQRLRRAANAADGEAMPARAGRGRLRAVPRNDPEAASPAHRQPGPAGAPEAAPGPAPDPAESLRPLPTPARHARAQARHWLVLASFLLIVALPVAATAWYMWERASPRFASQVGFSVRTEETSSALDFLGGMATLAGGSSTKDTDVLYRFIRSQEIVALVDARLDLRSLWAKGDPTHDPVFSYHPPGTIEDLHDYWGRMVAIYHDTSTGLLDLEVQAFAPDDAQAIAQAIYEESQTLINKLSDIAVTDRTRHAREELDESVERLKVAREAMTRFRNETQIVDPIASMQSQMGLLSSLEAQLAQTLIELDLLRQAAGDSDPRVQQALARVDVIEERMDQERQKLGIGRPGALPDEGETEADGEVGLAPEGEAFADLVVEYERLAVDQQFAQQAYVAALASYDAALAEGRQQSRYLAAHVEPTLAERAEYPQRWSVTLLTALFAGLTWMLLTFAGYALRDRR